MSSEEQVMTCDDFCECLRLLGSLQRQELVHLQAFTADDDQAWGNFKRDPLRWFLRADDHRASVVWGAIERGRKGRPPTNFVEDAEPCSELKVIQFIPRDDHDRR